MCTSIAAGIDDLPCFIFYDPYSNIFLIFHYACVVHTHSDLTSSDMYGHLYCTAFQIAVVCIS